ncbi:hypothetical protein IQ247_25740 [Plectonema cf. radiosum LEGE 06105]|uniref:DNA methylase N-4/N-6 domain-containing protein n=1 Tax=Plectonema cf. radiosum LEGE 06105 TaxID=945769 RepID=A0A8J7K468_9CYAN|nr:DNA methyltransferase [Plectonema radiosum]MBE9216022.1 hypothetical protein [Plectonema cf. radiosum LEGE 06105]
MKEHTSTFPLSLPLTCIEFSNVEKGIVLDPFMGSGTTAIAAIIKGFDYIGFELNKKNCMKSQTRIKEFTYQLCFDL